MTGITRAVFSDAARVCLMENDTPITTIDPETQCSLSFRFEHAGGVLRVTDGPLGNHVLAIGCEPEQINLLATLLLSGITHSR